MSTRHADHDTSRTAGWDARAKLTDEQVVRIRESAADGTSIQDIAARFGVSMSHTSAIACGNVRTEAGGPISRRRKYSPKIEEAEIVLEALARYEEDHGYFPDLRELRRLIGLKSTSGAHAWVQKLECFGWITRRPEGLTLRVSKVTPLGSRRLEEWRGARGQ